MTHFLTTDVTEYFTEVHRGDNKTKKQEAKQAANVLNRWLG